MSRFKLFIPVFILLMFTQFSKGQSLRVNYIGYTGYQTGGTSSIFYYGFGYEQNIGNRISLLIEYNNGYSLDEDLGYYYYEEPNSPINFEYFLEMPWYEFAYQSKYFFSGNDDGSAYVSSGIALRMVKYNMNIYSATYSQSGLPVSTIPEGLISNSYTLIPLSVKFGWRGSIDGWFGDYNIGFSYIPGASDKKSGNADIDQNLPDHGMKNFSINVGLTFGFGWAD